VTRHALRTSYLSFLNATLNRITSRIAQTGHGPFSLVRHVGRKSRRVYETPIIVARTADGFVAELTYGDDVNWYRNVVAAGSCVLIHHGTEYQITSIELLEPGAGRTAFPRPSRMVLKMLDRREFRLLRTDARGTHSDLS
jgi:hypothetical protein